MNSSVVRAAVVALGMLACGRSTPVTMVAVPEVADTSWATRTWLAGDVAAWRTPAPIRDLVALDDARGLALIGPNQAAVVDLATGAVTVHDLAVPRGSTLTRLYRVGAEVLALGATNAATAAWRLDPVTLAVTAVPFPEPLPGRDTGGRLAVAVSPDARQVFTCSDDRWPTLRDAKDLSVVRAFPDVKDCKAAGFLDATHVWIGPHSVTASATLDLGTGARGPGGRPQTVPGPGGRSVELGTGVVTVRGGDGQAIATHKTRIFTPLWLADGSAVASIVSGKLVVLGADGAAPRELPLAPTPLRTQPIPGGGRLLVQLGAHRLGVVDTATGALGSAEGTNLGPVEVIAAADGTVVSGAERVRMWRDGAAVAVSPPMTVQALDVDAGLPALVATFHGVYATALDSGESTDLDEEAGTAAIDRQGAWRAWDRDDRIMRQHGTDEPTAWMRRKSDYFVSDLDVATGRVALTEEFAFYIARPDQGELFAFHSHDCDSATFIWLERGGQRALTHDGVTFHLYDTTKRTALGGFELAEDSTLAATFIPGTTTLAVLGVATVYLWDPEARTVAAWPLPNPRGFDAKVLAVDGRALQLAVAFEDGAVMAVPLETVRREAKPVGRDVVTLHPGASLRCDKPIATDYDDLVEPEPEDEGWGEDEGWDGDPDD